MVDLGFGLIDKRTVILLVLTLVASSAIYGNHIPIDGENAVSIFAGVVILTGYVYLTRSIIRLPFAFLNQFDFLFGRSSWYIYEYAYDADLANLHPISVLMRRLVYILGTSAIILIRLPFHIFKYGERIRPQEVKGGATFLKIVDRLSLVGIAYVATIPALQTEVKQLGVAGVIFMIIVYLFRGSFSALIFDLIQEVDHSFDPRKDDPPITG